MYFKLKITTIIPALNEEVAISDVIHQLQALRFQQKPLIDQIIVCDNGSTDQTVHLAKTCGADVISEPERGYGAACLKGISSIDNTDVLLFLNADGSEKISEAQQILDTLYQQKADLVIGSRELGFVEKNALSLQQRVGNQLASWIIRCLWSYPITDLGPFRAIRYSSYQQLNMQEKNYGWTIEMQLKALRRELKVIEIPVSALCGKSPSIVSGTIKGVLGATYKILGGIFYFGIYDHYKNKYLKTTQAQHLLHYPVKSNEL